MVGIFQRYLLSDLLLPDWGNLDTRSRQRMLWHIGYTRDELDHTAKNISVIDRRWIGLFTFRRFSRQGSHAVDCLPRYTIYFCSYFRECEIAVKLEICWLISACYKLIKASPDKRALSSVEKHSRIGLAYVSNWRVTQGIRCLLSCRIKLPMVDPSHPRLTC